MRKSAVLARSKNKISHRRKKNAETLQQEVSREVGQLLQRIFRQRQANPGLGLEAVEMAVRSAMHQAGASVLTQLLEFDPPGPDQRQLPCACGYAAKYLGLRSKPVLTAPSVTNRVRFSRIEGGVPAHVTRL